MKTLLLVLLACFAFAADARFCPRPVSPRIIKVGKTPVITLVKDGKCRVEVISPNTMALGEFRARFQELTGSKPISVKTPSGKYPCFHLGVSDLSKKLGLDVKKLDTDGYFIKTSGNNILILGCDENYQYGTLFAVYEFMERFGGVRYYFPGKIGTIVPEKKNWSLPEIDITDRPDLQLRSFHAAHCSSNFGRGDRENFYYPGSGENAARTAIAINRRLRHGYLKIPNCHGILHLDLPRRFGKTHPEYFALDPRGKRIVGGPGFSGHDANGHLCFSSEGLKNEVYLDCEAALTGKPASTRGLDNRHRRSLFRYPFVNPMPNDGMKWCQCPECKAAEQAGPVARSEVIWKFMADIAQKLKDNGVKGYLTNMAYAQYTAVPRFSLPDNICVMLAITGPWTMGKKKGEEDHQLLLDWNKKLNAKTYLWTYPCKSIAPVAGVPNFTPRAVGAYYKKTAPHIFGTFALSGSDRYLFEFMNLYVTSRILWDINTDVDALLKEHCQLMYGKAAPEMSAIYDIWEDLWMNRIFAEARSTSLGYSTKLPTLNELWTKIYSPEKIREIDRLFDRAEQKAAADKKSLERVRFIRKYLWQNVKDSADKYFAGISGLPAWTVIAGKTGAEKIRLDGDLSEKAWQSAEKAFLSSRRSDVSADLSASARILLDKDCIYVGMEAEEPETSRMLASALQKKENAGIWQENSMEVFFSGSRNHKKIYQLIFTSSGNKADLVYGDPSGTEWNSGFELAVSTVPGKKWTAELRIPRSAMPEIKENTPFAANFTRHRVLKDSKAPVPLYIWSPALANTPEYCGVILTDKSQKPVSLIDGDFTGKVIDRKRILPHPAWTAPSLKVDHREFTTGGVSLRLEKDCRWVYKNLLLKPGKKYNLTFYLKTRALSGGMGVRPVLRLSRTTLELFRNSGGPLKGTHPWQKYSYTFTAPETLGTPQWNARLEFQIGPKTSGTAWVDHVELFEVK